RLVAHRRHGDRPDARLVGGRDRAEERSEAVAAEPDARWVDLRAVHQPVDGRPARLDPGVHAEIDVQRRALVLAGTIEREHGHAAGQPAVAVERDAHLLEAVHARQRHDDGDAIAAVTWW